MIDQKVYNGGVYSGNEKGIQHFELKSLGEILSAGNTENRDCIKVGDLNSRGIIFQGRPC
jgi:altronate dehydratase